MWPQFLTFLFSFPQAKPLGKSSEGHKTFLLLLPFHMAHVPQLLSGHLWHLHICLFSIAAACTTCLSADSSNPQLSPASLLAWDSCIFPPLGSVRSLLNSLWSLGLLQQKAFLSLPWDPFAPVQNFSQDNLNKVKAINNLKNNIMYFGGTFFTRAGL